MQPMQQCFSELQEGTCPQETRSQEGQWEGHQ